MSKPLTLTSIDGIKVTIDEKSASRSVVIKDLLQHFQDERDIPMTDVRGDVLKKIVEYLIHYRDSEPREIPSPLPSANLIEFTDEWDVTFINGIDLDTTFDVINAANFMDIKPLLDLCCAKVACVMKGMTAQEIRNMLNIECDLTKEELKEYEEYLI